MSKVVQIAEKEIGTIEVPKYSNKTKYGKWFGLDGMAWCGMFVSWCYAQAGMPLPNIGFTKGFAGCQTAVAYFKKKFMITKEPVSGDIVFFDWNKDGRYDHTGIFVKWLKDKKEFETIEGNTSLTNQSNGGQVMRRIRNNGNNVLFVHLK
jgi:cell wall-associated NlpC family hydrolase